MGNPANVSQPDKHGTNDADGLAQLAEVGFYREVRVKGYEAMLTRALPAARHLDRLVQPNPWRREDVRTMPGRCSPSMKLWRGSFCP
jgi:hypothetical protein